MMSIYDFEILTIEGKPLDWKPFIGRKLLLVNTASECGFTSQLAGLQELYTKYKSSGLEIIGVPCNDFGAQEPGSEEEILGFCQIQFDVEFPLTSKMTISGPMAHPMYQWLQQKKLNGIGDFPVTWNFQKFCINEQGIIEKVISPATEPDHKDLINWISQTQLF